MLQVRRFLLEQLPDRKVLVLKYLTKYYFRENYDIFYYKFSTTNSTEFGLMVGNCFLEAVPLDETTFKILTTDVLATLSKTVYVMSLDENPVHPIVVFEVQKYDEPAQFIAEIKFKTKFQSENFKVPDWFGTELKDEQYDLHLAFPKKNIATFDELDLYEQVAASEESRNSKLGTFESRLQKSWRRPRK